MKCELGDEQGREVVSGTGERAGEEMRASEKEADL